MNSVVLSGRLTHNPEVRYAANENQTAHCGFRIAVAGDVRDEVDFISCKVFGGQAESLARYKRKGDEIIVQGRIKTGSYKNKEGNTVYTTEVFCNRVEFVSGSKRENNGESEPRQTENRQSSFRPVREDAMKEKPTESYTDWELPDSFEQADEDIPF